MQNYSSASYRRKAPRGRALIAARIDEVELSNAALNSILDELERSARSAEVVPMRSRA